MGFGDDSQLGEKRFESVEAFLAWAEGREDRYELVDGAARMMTGGSANHSRIGVNVARALAGKLEGGPCEAFNGDAGVRLGDLRLVYPDASVVCERVDGYYMTSPVVIVEALSPSTEAHDLGTKAGWYRRLPSLRHLLIVRQDRVEVGHYHRAAAVDEWGYEDVARVDGVVRLEAIGVELSVVEIYARVELGG